MHSYQLPSACFHSGHSTHFTGEADCVTCERRNILPDSPACGATNITQENRFCSLPARATSPSGKALFPSRQPNVLASLMLRRGTPIQRIATCNEPHILT